MCLSRGFSEDLPNGKANDTEVNNHLTVSSRAYPFRGIRLAPDIIVQSGLWTGDIQSNPLAYSCPLDSFFLFVHSHMLVSFDSLRPSILSTTMVSCWKRFLLVLRLPLKPFCIWDFDKKPLEMDLLRFAPREENLGGFARGVVYDISVICGLDT
ncbi:hypothetical protein RHMOL_Rhmol04G0059500 [Rhododendron molle]|uniref:Uncharacterized protein n=1 Tax=Rhododendron molle TaxID=49168 RepID=A0ACC0NYS8_RHOML|nr:hypothetical protein RHMOL_Rhmol04G0059500 [Rhododendron molle]